MLCVIVEVKKLYQETLARGAYRDRKTLTRPLPKERGECEKTIMDFSETSVTLDESQNVIF